MDKKHYNVVAGVVKRDGKVLCMQRGESRYEYTTLKWEFPGGKIEAGEMPQDALKRELMEEMEYKVEPVERLVKVEHEYPDFYITLDVWLCRAESDEFEMKEHKDYRWLEPNELASLDFAEADKKAIKAIWNDARSERVKRLRHGYTLLGGSEVTDFTYKIECVDFSDDQIANINGILVENEVHCKLLEIEKIGGKLAFREIGNKLLNDNLILIDSCMPNLLAAILLKVFGSDLYIVKDVSNAIIEENPLEFDLESSQKFYELKLKRLLTEMAFGMKSMEVWNCVHDVDVVAVSADGSEINYYGNKLEFEDWLFRNAGFVKACSDGHEFGKIEREDDGSLIIKLNLGIEIF